MDRRGITIVFRLCFCLIEGLVLFVFSPVFEAFFQFRFKAKDLLTGIGM